MLYYDYADELLEGEAGELLQFMEVYNMAESTIETSLVSEFEIRVYENPGMTLDDMNKLYFNLAAKYGIYYTNKDSEVYSWVDISHIFEVPCYYIGYCTSAFTGLDLLTLSEDNYHEAVEKYMELTTLSTYAPYCAAVEYAGLRDVFEKGTAKEIMQETVDILEKTIEN